MSRPRLPNRVKAARGTLQPCRVRAHQDVEGTPLNAVPPPATGMSAAAAAFWRRWAPLCHEKQMLDADDLPAFEELCEAAACVKRWRRKLAKDGPTVTNRFGERVANPLARVLHAELANFRALCGQFGNVPMDRAKINAQHLRKVREGDTKPTFADPLDAIIRKRRVN